MTLPVGAILQDMYGERYRVENLLGIRGTFNAVDRQGQSLGEYGNWNVSVTPGK